MASAAESLGVRQELAKPSIDDLHAWQAWLADVLSRIAGHPAQRIAELSP